MNTDNGHFYIFKMIWNYDYPEGVIDVQQILKKYKWVCNV